MKLTVLGSAAAEGWPALFCECATCQEARKLGGRNLRRRTAYRLDDGLLIDFGPDALWQVTEFGIDLSLIDDILLTHSHGDHLTPMSFYYRRQGYSVVTRQLAVHGNAHALKCIRDVTGPSEETFRLALHEVRPAQQFRAGPYAVTALEAQHASDDEDALNYIIQGDGQTILIGHDTGWWPEHTWDLVAGFRIDLAILECTYGLLNADMRSHHLGVAATVAFRDELQHRGALAAGAHVVANHFSHNGAANYDELCEWFAPHGIEVGYDGLVLEI